MKLRASLFDVDFFESLHEDVPFCWVRASHGQDRKRSASLREIYAFIQNSHHSNLLKVFLDSNLPELWVSSGRQKALDHNIFVSHVFLDWGIREHIFVTILAILASRCILLGHLLQIKWDIFSLQLFWIVVDVLSLLAATIVVFIRIFARYIINERLCSMPLLFTKSFAARTFSILLFATLFFTTWLKKRVFVRQTCFITAVDLPSESSSSKFPSSSSSSSSDSCSRLSFLSSFSCLAFYIKESALV